MSTNGDERLEQLEEQILEVLHQGLMRSSSHRRKNTQPNKEVLFEHQQIVISRGLLQPDECDELIKAAELFGFENIHQAQKRGYAFRDNGRIELMSPSIADALWIRTRCLAPDVFEGKSACGLSSRIRLYRYEVGQAFGPHVDGSDEFEDGTTSEYTCLYYLNGNGVPGDEADQHCNASGNSRKKGKTAASTAKSKGSRRDDSGQEKDKATLSTARADVTGQYSGAGSLGAAVDNVEGGETVFYADHDCKKVAYRFAPLKGAMLLHGHGERCMTHEGAAVKQGVKYLLRTDVLYQ
eukprot:GFYU01019433.1.p1 GENE.GFYU01019433.1~~GFYU01019433.1.p1  ORF type:complete len:295 (-),score=69.11 GFYU01019433.1:135-1019(-)